MGKFIGTRSKPRSDHPAQKPCVSGNAIKRRRRSEIHDDRVTLVEFGGREGVYDPVGANGEGLLEVQGRTATVRLVHLEGERKRGRPGSCDSPVSP